MQTKGENIQFQTVAPPRGERGLKFGTAEDGVPVLQSRSPSWGAWIEMARARTTRRTKRRSLPLVGSVD